MPSTFSPLVLPDMRQRFLLADGHRLAVLCCNEEKDELPVVFLHGIVGAYTFWTHVMPARVREQRRWYSVTLPGHFPAILPPDGRTGMHPQELRSLLAVVLDELIDSEPVVLVGNSTGGYAALVGAAALGERIRGVAAINSFAAGPWQGVLGLLQWLAGQETVGAVLFRTILRASLISEPVYEATMSLFAADRGAFFSSPAAEKVVRAMYPYARRHSAEDMRRLFHALRSVDIRPVLPSIQAPALILAGSQDPVVAHTHQQDIAERIPDSELYLLEGAGHMLYAERAPRHGRILAEWLQRIFDRN